MTNFDFLKQEPKFKSFADVAISAEKILPIDCATAVINCRRAMEFAVKWMYSVDSSLVKPWDDKLVSLLSTDCRRSSPKTYGFYPQNGKFCYSYREESEKRAGGVMSGKSLYFS